nr:MAG TPA: hypothetical protein [Caudoviricetes sp.]
MFKLHIKAGPHSCRCLRRTIDRSCAIGLIVS